MIVHVGKLIEDGSVHTAVTKYWQLIEVAIRIVEVQAVVINFTCTSETIGLAVVIVIFTQAPDGGSLFLIMAMVRNYSNLKYIVLWYQSIVPCKY